MTYQELRRAIEKILPHASMDVDMDGQIVIYTDLMIDPAPGHDLNTVFDLVPYAMEDEEIPGDITRERYTE
jgi:hypothetical protein